MILEGTVGPTVGYSSPYYSWVHYCAVNVRICQSVLPFSAVQCCSMAKCCLREAVYSTYDGEVSRWEWNRLYLLEDEEQAARDR